MSSTTLVSDLPLPRLQGLVLVGQLAAVFSLPPTSSFPLHTKGLCIFLALSHSKKDQVSWQAGSSQE